MSAVSSEWKLSVIKQRFTLPEDTIVHIAMNPLSPEVYNKLIKCCKYFWWKNPVITLDCLCHYSRNKYWKTEKINGFPERQEFKIEQFNEKLWIYHDLTVLNEQNQLMASSLISKVYRCDLTCLSLSNQTLSFDEFQKFTSSGSLVMLRLFKTTVKNDDGTIVPIEKLIELFPKLQTFYFNNVPSEEGLQTITSETAANLNAIPHFPKIKDFTMEGIPESFEFEAFFTTPKVRTFFDCLIN